LFYFDSLSHHHFCFVATKKWDLNGFKLKSAKIRTCIL
jgi:hypothetical protein